jgi:hypothetical protein
LRWLRRHQAIVSLVVLVAAVWGALFVVYDYRSPVSQFLRGVGTVQMEGWSAYDLDAQCVRLEAGTATPVATPDGAIVVASKTYAGGYVREIALVSFHDTCSGANPRLAWAVDMAWTTTSRAAATTAGSQPRAIVLVDAITGKLIVSHAEGLP